MDFGLSEEQRILRDSVARFLGEEYAFDKRQKLLAEGVGGSALWPQVAELGWLALPISEEHGGLGGGAVEVALVMEQLGRALCVSPYLASVVLGIMTLEDAGTPGQKARVLPDCASGNSRIAFAHREVNARHERAIVETSARKEGGTFSLNGAKCAVSFAQGADWIVLSARTSGAPGDEAGISLFLVPGDAAGLARSDYATQDGGRASDLTLKDVHVEASGLIGQEGAGFDLIDAALDRAAAMACAESVGAMWSIHEMTLEYMKTRSQFGATLGSFQALQHRMVDMYMACELAQSAAMDAVASLERDDQTERRLAVSSAKVEVGRLGRSVGKEGIQLHGGIGMTMDMPLGHYFKRLTVSGLSFGDVDYHLNRIARVQVQERHNVPDAG